MVGELLIDLAGWRVVLRGRRLALSPREFCLLAHLARRPGRVVPYGELLEAVWECSPGTGGRHLVTSCMNRLRKKLGEDPDHPEYVLNVRGVGYRLRSQEQWEEAIRRSR